MFHRMLRQFTAFCFVLPLIVNSQSSPPVFTDSERWSRIHDALPLIDSMYQEYAKKNHFPGYAFALMVDGRVVDVGTGGYADLEQKVPVTEHTLFRIASMTKSVTAMAILKLRDQGKLKLDDPLRLYVPEIKQQKLTQDSPEITLRDLLTHSAGFPEDNPWGDRNLNKTDAELINLVNRGISLANPVGITYEYSNLGFSLLGLVVKKTSGMSYQQYVATNIWQPLAMNEAAWEFTAVSPKQLARGYHWDNEHWQEEPLLHDGSFAAMGGMFASINSFSHYVALHQDAWPARDDPDTGVLKRGSIREMHQPWRFYGYNPHERILKHECAMIRAYGYGLRWSRDCYERVAVGHSGGLPGFGSNWLFLPEYGIGVILFANNTYAAAEVINVAVLDTLIKKAHLLPRQLPVSSILQQRKEELLRLLPNWQGAQQRGLFAANFFLDSPLGSLQKESSALFTRAGKIVSVGALIAEDQLRGYFIMKGEHMDLKISFTLSPDNPALIQSYQMDALEHESSEIYMA